ncbi:hypothetical protein CDAR_188551 [Caerostris darwini]|uniref:Uncharacterized protein n=1 Tax=Caerostris darwini TaxID=1538125 RepID=A0AAV4V6C7_9ARAC|nr:hypothetical protein CDAR_188421 [Caerostris darwini]GIY65782.1 hypothetical protein CDAR_188551 [Caerostris darwini]
MNSSHFVLNGTNAFFKRRRLRGFAVCVADNCPLMTKEPSAIPVNAGGARVLKGSRGSGKKRGVSKTVIEIRSTENANSRLTKPTNRDEPLIFALTVSVLHLHMNATDFLAARPFIVFGNSD